jgi:hypothetical protein
VTWLPLYRVWGQGIYKEEGSPDRRVVSLKEVLPNLAASYAVLWSMSGHGCRHGLVATSRHGVMWCHCAGRGGTVDTAVVRQPSCATWSPP